MHDHSIAHTSRAILVAGMHRSGTSAVTRILSLLGAALPDNLMAAHAQFNPTGFWESNDVVAINDRLLASAGTRWDEAYAIEVNALPQAAVAQFQAEVVRLLERDFASTNCLVIKDPRLTRTMPLWIEALGRRKRQVGVVVAVRHPMEVADSLARRDGFPVGKSVYLWLRYTLEAIRYGAGVPRTLVLYDELMRDWRQSVERIRQDLTLTWPGDVDDAAPAIEQFLDNGLRHHKHAEINWQPEDEPINPIIEFAAELYDALVRRSDDLELISDSITRRLAVLEAAYLPVMLDYARQENISLNKREELQKALTNSYVSYSKLEEILIAERTVYKNLEAEFNIKCQHIVLLRKELDKLKQQIEPREGGAG